MKRMLGWFVGVVVGLMMVQGVGVADTLPAAAGGEADRAALRALMPLYERAVAEGKPELLQPHLAPDFSGVMVTGDAVGAERSMKDYWQQVQGVIGEGGTYRVAVKLAGPATIVGDMAVAHGTTEDVVTRGSREYRFQGQWTAVLRRMDGQWKVQRVHASMYPISNPFVAELVRGTAMMWAAGAGLAGIVLGVVLHMLLARRRRGAA